MEGLTAEPKTYQIELKVDVPGRYVGEIDAETGEYRSKGLSNEAQQAPKENTRHAEP